MIDHMDLTINELEHKLYDAAAIAEQMAAQIKGLKLDGPDILDLLEVLAIDLRHLRNLQGVILGTVSCTMYDFELVHVTAITDGCAAIGSDRRI